MLLNTGNNQLSDAEGSIVIIDHLNKLDPETFMTPSRNVLRASLIDLQNIQKKTDFISIGTGPESIRYNRLLSFYARTYEIGGQLANKFADFTFLRASYLNLPPLGGARGDFRDSYLHKANFEGGNFSGANFDRADLTEAQFQLGMFKQATFRENKAPRSQFCWR